MTAADPLVIVGGGPAGAVAALALARAKVPCLVFERNLHVVPKVCGEFLSPEAVALLTNNGFPWRQAEAVTLNKLCVCSANRQIMVPLPFSPAAQSVARPFLDAWLLNQAEACGARVERGVSVQTITPIANGFRLETTLGAVETPTLLLATGKHAVRGFHTRTPPRTQNLIGYKMNFEALSASLLAKLQDTLHLFFFEGGYGGIARIDDGTATVSLLIQGQAAKAQGCKDLALLRRLGTQVPLLHELLATATPAWARPLTVANLPYGHCDPRTPTHPRMLAVGDQFAVLPSFTGTGLSFALTSGALAAQSLIESPHNAAEVYAQKAHKTARAVMGRAMWLHRALQRPAFSGAALRALAIMPQLATVVARGTRLPAMAWPPPHARPSLREHHG